MNDEQFKTLVSNIAPENVQAFLRARDTAQREALARVEAELKATDQKLLAKTGAHEFVKHGVNRLVAERDTTQAQLAEAVGLLWFIQGYLEEGQDSHVKSKIRSFISRHRLDEYAQAEQQEAQGAQTGDDGYAPSPEERAADLAIRDRVEGRAALATQPAVPEQYEYWCIAFGRWRPIQELVEFLASRGFKVRAVRGAEHE